MARVVYTLDALRVTKVIALNGIWGTYHNHRTSHTGLIISSSTTYSTEKGCYLFYAGSPKPVHEANINRVKSRMKICSSADAKTSMNTLCRFSFCSLSIYLTSLHFDKKAVFYKTALKCFRLWIIYIPVSNTCVRSNWSAPV